MLNSSRGKLGSTPAVTLPFLKSLGPHHPRQQQVVSNLTVFPSHPRSILRSVKERVYGNTESPMFVFSPTSGLSDNEILFLSRWGIAESNRRLVNRETYPDDCTWVLKGRYD